MKNLSSQVLPFFIFLFFSQVTVAQHDQPPFTPAVERINSFDQRQQLKKASIVNEIPFESKGPTVFSGRVADLDVWEEDPSHFYVGYASGGLWKTEDNGISFEPLFDQELVMTIGDIAVDWDRNVIWVGTGEVNSSRSSYAGVGMYKSTDGGNTWTHKGLGESHHIGRIILHPTDTNTLWVAVLGHLYSPNQERGIYKTTDGGNTWTKTLFVSDDAGAVDLSIDPNDPDKLYAAIWHRERRAWNFVESGEGSGIYKSEDGGENWTKISGDKNRFPDGEGAGRIGLALTQEKGKTVLYASVDNYFRREKKDPEEEELTKDILRKMTKEDFLNTEEWQIKEYLARYNFPEEYSLKKVMDMIEKDEIKPLALAEYVEDANSLLFDTEVKGFELYKSTNEGKSWTRTHEDYLNNVYFTYGYYFGQLRIAPDDPKKIYALGYPVIRSDDGGKTWKSLGASNVHVDHHALWVNPNRPGHLILGNDGGVNISYDDGAHWIKCNTPAVGQFYAVAVDEAQPYNIYGGLQDNGVWYGPHTYRPSVSWHGSGQYPYEAIMGGDGMQVAVDTRDNATVYTGYQFGNYFRLNTKTGKRSYITPKHKLGERPLRWNWQAPIHLSSHNQDIFYMGSNKLHRSFNQGEEFDEISEDLTKGGKKGDVAFGTLTSIHESPLRFGLIYTGSDDGLLHVTRDGGNTWKKISTSLPQDMWVSRVFASSHEEGRVYIALNGYRWDDFTPYLYASEDYGDTWKKIGTDLPLEPVNVIKEDPENQDLLYVGTDHGLYVSLNRGQSFMLLNNGLPAAPVHDLVVHPTEKDLIVGTHGRSIYLASVKELQQLTQGLLDSTLYVFDVRKVRYSSRWGNNDVAWVSPTPPKATIPLYSNSEGKVNVQIQMGDDFVLQTFEVDVLEGLNYIDYDLTVQKKILDQYNEKLNEEVKKEEKPIKVKESKDEKVYIYRGSYSIVVKKNGAEQKTKLVVE